MTNRKKKKRKFIRTYKMMKKNSLKEKKITCRKKNIVLKSSLSKYHCTKKSLILHVYIVDGIILGR